MEWQLKHEESFQRDGEMLRKAGNLPKIWENPVYPKSRFTWLWEAFTDLDSTRLNIMSMGRISINAIFDYCRSLDYNLEETHFLKSVILKVDLKYITLSNKISDEKDKKEKKQNAKTKKFGT